ncbi:UNVERIFIED_ORG: hypothetical protein ABIC97_004862 [Peribacillus simplex]
MKISQTRNFNLVAKLNKYVHDLHPKYFKGKCEGSFQKSG